MNNFLRSTFSAALFLFSTVTYATPDQGWSLLMHIPTSDVSPLAVSPQQQQWLAKKQTLVVGILPNDVPPYGLRNDARQYEGLSADTLGLVAKQLGLEVTLKRFDNTTQLWQALVNGDIDLIPSVTRQDNSRRFLFSVPYSSELPVLAIRSDDNQPLPLDLVNTKVAVAADYLPLEQIQARYPEAKIQVYESTQEALSAVSYGDTRVFLGNSYLIGRNLFNNLRVERIADLPQPQISFALRQDSRPLEALINQALQNIPREKALETQQFWQAGTRSALTQLMQPLHLSPAELRWIHDHPSVNVLLYGTDNSAPMAFLDRTGAVRGIAIDVLNIVEVKTGMKFRFHRTDTINELIDETNTSQADMIAAISPSSERLEKVLFSLPYARSAFALITPTSNKSIKQLADLRGKKLAIVKQATLSGFIASRYPEIKIVEFNNDGELFDSVVKGKTDAAVALTMVADYKINNIYHDKLKIANTASNVTAYISFAVGKNDPELLSILNKVLMTVPPFELEMIANRWRPNNMVVVDTFWQSHHKLLLSAAAAIILVLLLALFRAYWLRRQMVAETERRRQLSLQLKLMEQLVESMPFPIIIRDLEGRLTYCNQLTLDFTGKSYEQVKGRTLQEADDYLPPDVIQTLQQKMNQVHETDRAWHEDMRIKLDGRPHTPAKAMTLSIWIMPWHDIDANVVGTVMALWDVSEREELIHKLSEATERAEASNRAKSTFLSTMSHEIRTPMNAIIGMLDMAIKQGKNGQQDLEALAVASESAQSLVGLIGDILDLSRIEGDHLHFTPERINPGALINQLLVIFNGLALDKNILLHKHFPEDEVVDVIGDPLRIKQVLSNVLSNAIKFTDRGGVTLNLGQHIDSDKQHARFEVEILDSGVGIDPDQQDKLFQPFSQAENHRAGTGLGLYISRSICEAMGGNLTLSSVMNEGTRVVATFTLPLAGNAVAIERRAEETLPQSTPLNILVVDDNNANRILLAKQLAWLGHHAHVAENAFQALAQWQNQTFDAIITDCNMPGMNGYQLTQEIREQEAQKAKSPVWIIGFTANAMQEVIDRCLAAGMNTCIFKPCTIADLAQALSERNKKSADENITLETLFMADECLEQEFQQRQLVSVKSDYDKMKQARKDGDWQAMGDLAHRMLGGVRIIKDKTLAECCEQLELASHSQPHSESYCQACWEKLSNHIEIWLAK